MKGGDHMIMTVRQLIDSLKDYPEDAQIVLASDPEGNNYHTADGVLDKYIMFEEGTDKVITAVVLFPEHGSQYEPITQ